MHNQYEQLATFLIILSLGLLLGWVRYKSQNTAYCIAIHMLFNGLAIAIFLCSSFQLSFSVLLFNCA